MLSNCQKWPPHCYTIIRTSSQTVVYNGISFASQLSVVLITYHWTSMRNPPQLIQTNINRKTRGIRKLYTSMIKHIEYSKLSYGIWIQFVSVSNFDYLKWVQNSWLLHYSGGKISKRPTEFVIHHLGQSVGIWPQFPHANYGKHFFFIRQNIRGLIRSRNLRIVSRYPQWLWHVLLCNNHVLGDMI